MRINITIIVVMLGLLLAVLLLPTEDVVVYDCGMAEWHPDIPKEVKEECRRIHYEHWKEQQLKKMI